MRDKRFVAEHRGGPLSIHDHKKLIRWAWECSEHVLPLLTGEADPRIIHALHFAREWESNHVRTGEAMKASLGAHAAARASFDPVHTAIARSAGHGVATAHMADHSMGAAIYALKAVKLAGKSVETERLWQIVRLQNLPSGIIKLVLTVMAIKEAGFKR